MEKVRKLVGEKCYPVYSGSQLVQRYPKPHSTRLFCFIFLLFYLEPLHLQIDDDFVLRSRNCDGKIT